MQAEDFDYFLPPELIAQEPLPERSDSRLLLLDRVTGMVGETPFATLCELLNPGDLLVVNDTRVIPARLAGTKESGGRVEVFLVRKVQSPGEVWQCLIRASKSPRPGTRIHFSGGFAASVTERGDGECWLVAFSPAEGFGPWLEQAGSIPLPPYIRRPAENADRERYQTVFARNKGAVAAPTAGLHFTPQLLDAIRRQDVEVVSLTLHVGLGTFLPMRVSNVKEHRMHREWYSIPEATAAAVTARKRGGGRVIAVGTTTVRALEQAASLDGTVLPGEGEADIFIYPGYRFKTVDALITNFHLPQSTLLMLVAAFAGKEPLLRSYAEAVERRFRFFSYGDAMYIS